MSHGVPNFAWRDGRPRWIASPALRAKGWKGRDLKDSHGAYLPLDPALDLAREINNAAGQGSSKPPAPSAAAVDQSGFVYFLWAGNAVKIGFSVQPFVRAAQLATGLSGRVRLMGVVAASRQQEQLFHAHLRMHNIRGEWFHDHPAVTDLLLATIREGRLVIRKRK